MNLHPTAHLIAEYLRAKPAQAPECLAPTLTLPGVPIAAPAARQTPSRAIRDMSRARQTSYVEVPTSGWF